MPDAPIALIGPYLAGKTTIRRLLAAAPQRPEVALVPWQDEALVLELFAAAGWDPEEERRVLAAGGDLAQYLRPFQVAAIEQAVARFPGHIMAVEASWPVQDDPDLFERVRQALGQCAHVILLLPSPDRKVSYHVLRERYWTLIDIDANEIFVRHASNHRLAKQTIYTEGQTPRETADTIVARLAGGLRPATPIILIGPPAAGKSTVSALLAARLDLPHFGLDTMEPAFPPESGYDPARAEAVYAAEGLRGAWRYSQPFLAAVMDDLVRQHQDGILDFGAGHSVFEDLADLARVEHALAAYPNIFLLLPSSTLDESIRILKERPRSTINGVDANRYLIEHPAYEALATQVVYTEGNTPEETAAAIARSLV